MPVSGKAAATQTVASLENRHKTTTREAAALLCPNFKQPIASAVTFLFTSGRIIRQVAGSVRMQVCTVLAFLAVYLAGSNAFYVPIDNGPQQVLGDEPITLCTTTTRTRYQIQMFTKTMTRPVAVEVHTNRSLLSLKSKTCADLFPLHSTDGDEHRNRHCESTRS